MKTILAFLIILSSVLLTEKSAAQWRKIADFFASSGSFVPGEYITCVYFLDLPQPMQIGFVGTESELWKTTDDGNNWAPVWDSDGNYALYYITDICFKDSMIGWFSIFNSSGNTGDACYRTTDGGNHWSELPVPGVIYGADGIYFDSLTNRLLLSSADMGLLVSTDLGNVWNTAAPYNTGGFSFSSDSNGFVSASFSDTVGGFLITSDGGITWDTAHINGPILSQQPLAIPETPICFESDFGNEIIIRRSDDYGHTWHQLNDFGSNSPYGTGVIRGDLSHLYIQTDTGMYLSTDEGVTWKYDGGPTYSTNFTNDIFYSANGVTIAGMTYPTGVLEDSGLWEEEWPQSGVAEAEPVSVILSIFPNPAPNSITVPSATGTILIQDPLGRNYSVPRNGNTFDVSLLPSGVYFVSDGVSRAKFVKE
jgi:photosystem II stability/assembly factor-like uncharacterized protein